MTVSRNANIPHFDHREEYFDFFSGISDPNIKSLEKRQLPGGLQKSYLLETVGGDSSAAARIESVIRRSNVQVESTPGDDSIFRIVDSTGNGLALIEVIDRRYLVLYTLLPSNESDKLVHDLVAKNPLLDHLWLSSQTFRSIWNYVLSANSGRRYGRITFEHESLFDASEEPENVEFEDERRASRFSMVDRLSVIDSRIGPLSST